MPDASARPQNQAVLRYVSSKLRNILTLICCGSRVRPCSPRPSPLPQAAPPLGRTILQHRCGPSPHSSVRLHPRKGIGQCRTLRPAHQAFAPRGDTRTGRADGASFRQRARPCARTKHPGRAADSRTSKDRPGGPATRCGGAGTACAISMGEGMGNGAGPAPAVTRKRVPSESRHQWS